MLWQKGSDYDNFFIHPASGWGAHGRPPYSLPAIFLPEIWKARTFSLVMEPNGYLLFWMALRYCYIDKVNNSDGKLASNVLPIYEHGPYWTYKIKHLLFFLALTRFFYYRINFFLTLTGWTSFLPLQDLLFRGPCRIKFFWPLQIPFCPYRINFFNGPYRINFFWPLHDRFFFALPRHTFLWPLQD